jgi:N-acetyl-anhydromuramyl-L-alanine amidase AmpD
MEFVQANRFRSANRGADNIERIVVHTAEIAETRSSAEDVAAFFARSGTEVSAHITVDNNSTVRCVRDKDIAFHALGDNHQSLGAELSGRASQSFREWRDDYSKAVIENFAFVAAHWCHDYGIPMRWLTDDQLERRIRGFTTHDAVSRVFGDDIRDDPGRNFPFELCERRVEFYLAQLRKVSAWEVSFLDADDARVEAKTKEPPEWTLAHPGAFQRGRVSFVPSERG